jgi:DNA-binding response OmpR family regulator
MTALQLRKTVLLIEDDLDTRDALFLILSDQGYAVRAAEDRDSALEILREEKAAVILTDLHMPGMTLSDFADHVRRNDPETRIIVISADPNVSQHISGAGLNHCFQKPLDFNGLLGCIRAMFSKQ